MAPEREGRADPESASPAFDAGLHAEGVTFGHEDALLLERIDEEGSLNAATDAIDRSYPRTLDRLDELEGAFGTLVESERGGASGGGSELTPRARDLLSRFERLRTEFAGITAVGDTVYEGCVVDRDGELATIWTRAGELHALAPPDATNVQVTIRADTVTVHDPAVAPVDTETSARNRFDGTVVDVDESASIARLTVDIGGEQPLKALVTTESCEDLGLGVGEAVVVSFKTVATRAVER